ncbi:MAG: hypothetical protein ABIO86_20625 [Sphingomonas sp.]
MESRVPEKSTEMEEPPLSESESARPARGKGRGSRFFALAPETWERLWTVETVNRLNLVTAFLVLLAGTGSDHRLTKWSAKACEEHAGMGKPRAKRAIEELITTGLVERTAASTPVMPQYRMPELPRDLEPIFLPVQLITGLAGETPVLRRVRETGDALALRMLIDLYALIQTDATHGVPIQNLRQSSEDDVIARKVFEMGATGVWALVYGNGLNASGDWVRLHYVEEAAPGDQWRAFWDRVRLLRTMGALWFEPWIFDSLALDAEPLMPVDPNAILGAEASDPVARLTDQSHRAASALAGERSWLIEHHSADVLLPLALHQQSPVVRGVARLRVEADTPGRRRSYALRMQAIERYAAAYARLEADAYEGRYDRPVSAIIAHDVP